MRRNNSLRFIVQVKEFLQLVLHLVKVEHIQALHMLGGCRLLISLFGRVLRERVEGDTAHLLLALVVVAVNYLRKGLHVALLVQEEARPRAAFELARELSLVCFIVIAGGAAPVFSVHEIHDVAGM